MTAKEYLNSINILRHKVEEKKRQLEEIEELATSLGSMDYSKDRIVASPQGDSLEKKAIKIYEKRQEYSKAIVRYLEAKEEIVEEINEIQNETYRQLLIMRYAEGLRLEEIAVKMHFNYDYVRRLHGNALLEFEREVLKDG